MDATHAFVRHQSSNFTAVLRTKTLKSSTFRLALICVVLFGAAVIVLLGYVYWVTVAYEIDRSDRTIMAEHASLRQIYQKSGRDGLAAVINQRISEGSLTDGVYLLSDASLAPLAGNLKAWPTELHADVIEDLDVSEAAPEPAGRHRIRASYESLPDGSHLLVGRAMDDLNEFVQAIKTALELGVTLTFVLAAVAAIFVTRRTVGRIDAINATTQEIMRSGLGRRIPLRGTKDEWDQLAQNLNSMLDRIEQLVREVKQVSDNVAHDLRTPLARLQGRLQKAYHLDLDPAHYRELIGDTIKGLQDILGIFASLLRISRIEALDPRSTFRIVDLCHLAGEVADLFDAAAEEQGGRVKLVTRGKALALGDRDFLFEAISNVIDNAIKYGGGGDVLVEVANDGRGSVLSVGDHGPGIPAEERSHVLQRFYRLDHSRASPGNGLGLSLVAAVAQLHGVAIEMMDNEPGLKLELRFPPATVSGVRMPASGLEDGFTLV